MKCKLIITLVVVVLFATMLFATMLSGIFGADNNPIPISIEKFNTTKNDLEGSVVVGDNIKCLKEAVRLSVGQTVDQKSIDDILIVANKYNTSTDIYYVYGWVKFKDETARSYRIHLDAYGMNDESLYNALTDVEEPFHGMSHPDDVAVSHKWEMAFPALGTWYDDVAREDYATAGDFFGTVTAVTDGGTINLVPTEN